MKQEHILQRMIIFKKKNFKFSRSIRMDRWISYVSRKVQGWAQSSPFPISRKKSVPKVIRSSIPEKSSSVTANSWFKKYKINDKSHLAALLCLCRKSSVIPVQLTPRVPLKQLRFCGNKYSLYSQLNHNVALDSLPNGSLDLIRGTSIIFDVHKGLPENATNAVIAKLNAQTRDVLLRSTLSWGLSPATEQPTMRSLWGRKVAFFIKEPYGHDSTYPILKRYLQTHGEITESTFQKRPFNIKLWAQPRETNKLKIQKTFITKTFKGWAMMSIPVVRAMAVIWPNSLEWFFKGMGWKLSTNMKAFNGYNQKIDKKLRIDF